MLKCFVQDSNEIVVFVNSSQISGAVYVELRYSKRVNLVQMQKVTRKIDEYRNRYVYEVFRVSKTRIKSQIAVNSWNKESDKLYNNVNAAERRQKY